MTDVTDYGGVSVWATKSHVFARSPFNSVFVNRARVVLGGRFSAAKQWVFSLAREAEVRALARRVYGTDGTQDPDVLAVLVRVGAGGIPLGSQRIEAQAIGVPLLMRWSRDGTVKLSDNVSLHSGQDFAASGGSQKYPTVGDSGSPARWLRVDNVGREIALEALFAEPEIYRRLDDERADEGAVEKARARLHVARMKLERAQAELDALLSSVSETTQEASAAQ